MTNIYNRAIPQILLESLNPRLPEMFCAHIMDAMAGSPSFGLVDHFALPRDGDSQARENPYLGVDEVCRFSPAMTSPSSSQSADSQTENRELITENWFSKAQTRRNTCISGSLQDGQVESLRFKKPAEDSPCHHFTDCPIQLKYPTLPPSIETLIHSGTS